MQWRVWSRVSHDCHLLSEPEHACSDGIGQPWRGKYNVERDVLL